MKVFHIFSKHSKDALKNAGIFARQKNCPSIGLKHLLYGIALEKGSIGSEILKKLKIPDLPKDYKKSLQSDALLDEDTVLALERAARTAAIYEHPYVGTEHILLEILELKNQDIIRILAEQRLSAKNLEDKLLGVLKSVSKFPSIANAGYFAAQRLEDPIFAHNEHVSKKSILDFFSTDLTDKKSQKNKNPLIGRGEEIERMMQILSRREKNNPLLIGPPGVGKTAMVEGLAEKISYGEVPEALMGKKIYTLDLGLLVAGTTFRGEFESRLKHILEEAKQNPNIILFIDEIHNAIGAGSASGSLDAANILKPALARGELRCIGATTEEEYKKYLQNDAAFERRFQIIKINEPSEEKTLEILQGLKSGYESFHRITITQDALKACVDFASRYFQEKFFPDKAIDIIDEAASRLKISVKPTARSMHLKSLQKQFKRIIEDKNEDVMAGDFDHALHMRHEETAVATEMKNLRNAENDFEPLSLAVLTQKEIREVVSLMTKIPLHNLQAGEKTDLLRLEEKISQNLAGQKNAVRAVAQGIRRAYSGIRKTARPLGSFLFLGPSGVGKTHLARVLADILFHDPESFIKIDMSEFSESHTISKLIGSPPGYVGYKDANILTDRVRKKPYSLVLFDEIEKAHPLIFNLMLQMLEDGRITDASSKTAHFSHAIIIMTSNLGSEAFFSQPMIGFGENEKTQIQALANFHAVRSYVTQKAQKFFRPEFLNRIDETLVFEPLAFEHLEAITHMQIKELRDMLKEKGVSLEYDKEALSHIAAISQSASQGARAIRKNIADHIENPLAEKLLENTNEHALSFRIAIEDGKIVIKI